MAAITRARSLSKAASAPSDTYHEALDIVDRRTGETYQIPINHNTVRASDFKPISIAASLSDGSRVQNHLRIYDPGFSNTCVQETDISTVDGERGRIQYRGYSIDYLYQNHDFEEVAYLLLWGHLPSATERNSFRRAFAEATQVPQCVQDVIQTYPRNAPAYTVLIAAISAWIGADPQHIPIVAGQILSWKNPEQIDKNVVRTYGAMAAMAAITNAHRHGRVPGKASPDRGIVDNLVVLMGLKVANTNAPDPKYSKHLAKLWILNAEHGMTNSTSCFLHAASSLADPLSCALAGFVAGAGPLHGGALDLAFKNFERVGAPNKVPAMIAKIKSGSGRLFGYGHRMYKTVDPRMKYYKAIIEDIGQSADARTSSLLAVALEIDRVAREDEYFVSRRLAPNADLYASLAYLALGFEPDIVIIMTSISRTVGLMAHWRVAMSRPVLLWRPQDLFVGKTEDVNGVGKSPIARSMKL